MLFYFGFDNIRAENELRKFGSLLYKPFHIGLEAPKRLGESRSHAKSELSGLGVEVGLYCSFDKIKVIGARA